MFSYVEFCLWDAMDDSSNFQRNFSTGEVEIEKNALYHKTEYRERRDHYAFLWSDRPYDGFDTARDAFLGVYGSPAKPAAVLNGRCTGSHAHGWAPVGAMEFDLELTSGEEKQLVLGLGYIENPQEAKFVSPGVINKAKAHAMMEKFGLPKSWLDRDDGATNSNLIYNGFPNHHGPAEAWQVGMLYNLVYNRDCMIHEIVCETGSGAPYDVTKKVMEDFFGEGCYDKAKAYTPINENKAKLAAYCVNDKNFHDSATLCNWMWPMTQSPSKERDYHGDLDLQADFMTAVTGETYTQAGLQEDGARITQMLRAMTAISFQQNCGSANLRQEHDAICDWVFDKDPDFKAFEEGTTKLDRADMEKAKDLFYDIFGWDKTTGVPTRETLEKFDLGDMADDLEARGIYSQTETAAQ